MAATLTAADAGADLLNDLRNLLGRHDGVDSPEDLATLIDEAAKVISRARGRLRRITRRAEPKTPTTPKPEPKVIPIGPDGVRDRQSARPEPAPAERRDTPPVAETRPEQPRPLEPARAVAADPPAVRPAPAAPQPAPGPPVPPCRRPHPRPVAAVLTFALLTAAAVCGAWTTTTRTTARTARATGRGLRRAGRWARRRLAGNRTAGSRP